jgi:cytochrome b6-f complex iron-sulfur subunit
MSSTAVIAIAIAAILVLAAVVLVTSARRSDVRGAGALSRETVKRDKKLRGESAPGGAVFEKAEATARSVALEKATEVAPVAWQAPDPEAVGVSRRQFFNRAAVTMMSASIGAFGVAVVAFLWPRAGGGFGSKVNVGRLDDLIVQIRSEKGFVYKPEARTWLTAYPADALPKARAAYGKLPSVLAGMEAGLVALYQKCPHLGCRVPECKSSQWFECPCHGSQYNRAGEKKAGPAPRGMDRFGIAVNNGNVIVDTGIVFNGPAIGVNTTGQEAEGPHCITGGGGH